MPRYRLVARDALADRMVRKDFSNRRLAKYAGCAPGTIDNLLRGTTQSLTKKIHAQRICEALDVPMDIFFVPNVPSAASHLDQQEKAS